MTDNVVGAVKEPVEGDEVARGQGGKANPLGQISEDYGDAVIHIAWGQESAEESPTLLFGWVELLPAEVPPPSACKVSVETRIGASASVSITHSITRAGVALDWYLAAREGKVRAPDESGEFSIELKTVAPLTEEPNWPKLVCGTQEIPFVPSCWDFPRVHHLIPDSDELSWSEHEKTEALDLISSRFHFAIDDFVGYVGSIHLVAPNPVFRRTLEKRHVTSLGDDELWIQLELRCGQLAEHLTLLVQEERPTGIICHIHPISRGALTKVPLDGPSQALKVTIVDPLRGTLFARGPVVFNVRAHMTTHLARTRKVTTPKGSYSVTTSGTSVEQVLGEKNETITGAGRIRASSASRHERTAARSSDQYWLDSREEALRVVRGLIHLANDEIILVDQWFGSADVSEFMLAIGNDHVSLRVLCGRDEHPSRIECPNARTNRKARETLQQLIDGLKPQGVHNDIEVRIMRGESPPFHDRFLYCDGAVWSLGSSLNHLGERGTVVVRLPAPEPVTERIREVWEQSTPLALWLATDGGSEAS